MASVISKLHRTIGSRIAAQWLERQERFDAGGVTSARVVINSSKNAGYTAAGGSQTLTIQAAKDATPTMVTVNVTLGVGVTTRQGIVDAINNAANAADVTFPDSTGLDSNPFKLAMMGDGFIIINNPYKLITSAISRASFEVHGIPVGVTKDITSAATETPVVDLSGHLAIDNQFLSQEIAVPDGANIASFWPSYQMQDTSNGTVSGSPLFLVGWSNGVEGVFAANEKSLLYLPLEQGSAIGAPSTGFTRATTGALGVMLPGVGFAWSAKVVQGVFSTPIPPGATGLRVVHMTSYDTLAATPITPPKFSCAVIFGAR